MTPAPPQHCNHECVCHLFLQNCFVGDSPCLEPCKDDTRPHTTTPSEREQALDELNDWIHSFNFISVSSCPTIFDVLEKIAELRTTTEAHR